MGIISYFVRRVWGRRWIVLQGYLDEKGEVSEWEPMGYIDAFSRQEAIQRAKAEWSRVPLSIREGRPLRAVAWTEASEEVRREAELQDDARLQTMMARWNS